MSDWFAEVIREREPKGPGTMRLYNGDTLVGEWSCITGGEITDPATYGGLTPPIQWMMVEPIKLRRHPQGHTMEMARLLPLWEGKSLYPKRSYELDGWPFMIHAAGSSSGCIAIHGGQWREAVEALNRAWAENTFLIEVRDQ
tara:strand:+ start:1579 stop:2004 length:426 start_codon:yes stop_codon:yes gene_type:complete